MHSIIKQTMMTYTEIQNGCNNIVIIVILIGKWSKCAFDFWTNNGNYLQRQHVNLSIDWWLTGSIFGTYVEIIKVSLIDKSINDKKCAWFQQ